MYSEKHLGLGILVKLVNKIVLCKPASGGVARRVSCAAIAGGNDEVGFFKSLFTDAEAVSTEFLLVQSS